MRRTTSVLGAVLWLCLCSLSGCKSANTAHDRAASSSAERTRMRCEPPLEPLRVTLESWAQHHDLAARRSAKQGIRAITRALAASGAGAASVSSRASSGASCAATRDIAEAALAQARAMADLTAHAQQPEAIAAVARKGAHAQQTRFEASRQRALATHAALPLPPKPPQPSDQANIDQDASHEAQDTELRPSP